MAYMTAISTQGQSSSGKSNVGSKRLPHSTGESYHSLPAFPHTISANTRIILEALRCFAGRQGRSNCMALGRSGLISILIRGIAITAGLPYVRSNPIPIHHRAASNEDVRSVSETGEPLSASTSANMTQTPARNSVLPILDPAAGCLSSVSMQNIVSGSRVINALVATVSTTLSRVPTAGLVRPIPHPIAIGVNSNSILLKNFLSALVVLMKYREFCFTSSKSCSRVVPQNFSKLMLRSSVKEK